MDLAHAIAAGGLAARTTSRRFATDEAEVADARQRAIDRRAAAVEAEPRSRVVYRERGRHAAPAPARPRPA